VETLRSAFKELESVSHSLSEKLYQEAGGSVEEPVSAGVGAGKSEGNEDVIDAEFKEEK
jgi:hypothetical protein